MITLQTETPEIAAALGVDRLYMKREDLHPYGSHKGRSIPIMIDLKVAQGSKDFAISSSGNAALAALRHIQKRNAEGSNLSLSILVGEHINSDKLARLRSEITDARVTIDETPRPLQALFRLVKGDGRTSLRQSTDDNALIGYKPLAREIAATPDLAAVFIGTSSGTTAQALAEYFAEHAAAGTAPDPFTSGVPAIPAVHIVQTTSISPLARAAATNESLRGGLENDTVSDGERSIADAIIDKVAHREEPLVKAVKKTAGTGWVASNADIREAQKLLKEKAGIDATPNGALGLAGLIRARRLGASFKGSVVCIITGK
ncbi:MAG: PLP-dependent lyase/thiolase [Patescibacteria group bacterium]|nr:PLP-dependent lyase/thiolase [Patescibacteria group bacterium]MDE2116657.1 PLP-dependent lyase/thiolase [Patescibacteria group bacterium]